MGADTQSEPMCSSRRSLICQHMQHRWFGYQTSSSGQGDQVVSAGKFQPLSILSSNSSEKVKINAVSVLMFSLYNPGALFKEKMLLCAYKMSPLRVIPSAGKNTFHEVFSVLSGWSTALQTDASLWIMSSATKALFVIHGGGKKGWVHLQPALCCNAYQGNLQELHLAIPSPATSEPPASSRGSQQQVGDRSTSSVAACRAQHVSQPLHTQANGLFYQPARCLVPVPARTPQLEAQGCDKAGLGDGGEGWEVLGRWAHRQQYGEKWIYCSGVGHRRASAQRHKGPALICAAAHRTACFVGNV